MDDNPNTTALTRTDAAVPATLPPAFTLEPTNLAEAMEFAKLIASSDLAPKDYKGKPANVLIAVQMGRELGLPALQSIQGIAVINARPCVWGDALLGIIQASGKLEAIAERDPQEAIAAKEGRCEVRRRGVEEPVVRTFTIEMAHSAKLIERGGPESPWTKYPGRMLQMRARSWALRDMFADVLKGLRSREEEEDAHEPIRMPRRASEATPSVDKFLTESTGAQPQAHAPAPSASAVPPERKVWIGTIADVATRSGEKVCARPRCTEKPAGHKHPWTVYDIKGEDGETFSTFDTKDRDFALQAGKSPVAIVWEESGRGKKLVGIEPEPAQREPGDEDPGA